MLKSAALFAAGALSVAGIAAAAPQAVPGAGGGQGQFRNTPLGRLVTGQIGRGLVLRSQLNVTDEQRVQIAAAMEAHRAELAKAVASVVEHKRALRDAATDDSATERDIRRKADELGSALGDAALVARKLHQEMKGVWTAEQQKLLDAFNADRRTAVDGWLSEIAAQ